MDMMMPGMDGFTVCQKLRESIRTAFIPVLMMTASPKSENQVQAISVGADDFLMKPLVPAQLQDKLKRLLHRTYGL
jgi:DNA-binding response OmpR family regulator